MSARNHQRTSKPFHWSYCKGAKFLCNTSHLKSKKGELIMIGMWLVFHGMCYRTVLGYTLCVHLQLVCPVNLT